MNAEDQLNEVKALRQQGRHAEALQMAQIVANLYPDNADAWWFAGLAAHSLKKFPESLAALKETIKLASRWAPGWAQYGVVLDENGQKEEGIKRSRSSPTTSLRIGNWRKFSKRRRISMAKFFT